MEMLYYGAKTVGTHGVLTVFGLLLRGVGAEEVMRRT